MLRSSSSADLHPNTSSFRVVNSSHICPPSRVQAPSLSRYNWSISLPCPSVILSVLTPPVPKSKRKINEEENSRFVPQTLVVQSDPAELLSSIPYNKCFIHKSWYLSNISPRMFWLTGNVIYLSPEKNWNSVSTYKLCYP